MSDPTMDDLRMASRLVLALADDIASGDPERRDEALLLKHANASAVLRPFSEHWAALLRQALWDAEHHPEEYRRWRVRHPDGAATEPAPDKGEPCTQP